jgi:RNA polymerase sigma-70 factor (ECF subfamily)
MEPGPSFGQVVVVGGDEGEWTRARVRDPASFEEVFDEYHAAIWRYLARLRGATLADDLAGEVFVAAFKGRERFDPARGSLRAWLYGIASNVARTQARKEHRRRGATERAAVGAVEAVSPIDTAIDDLASQDQLQRVRAALGHLPAADRELVVLYAWEELSYEEIAAVLEIKVGTVKSRLARARARLRELVASSGKEAADG